MSKDELAIRLAKIEVAIDQIVERLDAIEWPVSWLLAQQPNNAGYSYLCDLANDIEDDGTSPGVVSEVDLLRSYVAALRDQPLPEP